MTVYEMARELGQELLKTPETERVLAAKKAYDEDPKAVNLIEEYNAFQKDYQSKLQNPDLTQEEYQSLTNEVMEKGNVIKAYPVTAELIEAEGEFNQYLNSIFNIITSTISGDEEEPSCGDGGGCNSGCCGGCGGGCH